MTGLHVINVRPLRPGLRVPSISCPTTGLSMEGSRLYWAQSWCYVVAFMISSASCCVPCLGFQLAARLCLLRFFKGGCRSVYMRFHELSQSWFRPLEYQVLTSWVCGSVFGRLWFLSWRAQFLFPLPVFQFYIVGCAEHCWFVFIDLWPGWNVVTCFLSILYLGF